MADPRKILENKLKHKFSEEDLKDEIEHISLSDFLPIPWDRYFSAEAYIDTPDGKFHVFYVGSTGPICFLIHGAGYSAQTWCLFSKELLKETNVRLVAIDLRGHGSTHTDNDSCLSKNLLVHDIIAIIDKVIMILDINEKIILIGHSLGGALATWVASGINEFKISCLIVIDVDEQSALNEEAMVSAISSVPTSFSSLSKAIKYSYSNRKIKNIEADCASIPSQLIKCSSFNTHNSNPKDEYIWRLDLLSTKDYWKDWFLGFSKTFVSLKIPRLFAVSDIERIDKTLLIGQMQGLFRVEPIAKCGHTIHEDDPIYISKCVAKFLKSQGLV